jgi:hypothetical protein
LFGGSSWSGISPLGNIGPSELITSTITWIHSHELALNTD